MSSNAAGRDGITRKKDSLQKRKNDVRKLKRKETAKLFFKPMTVVPDKVAEEVSQEKAKKKRHAYEIFGDVSQDEMDEDYVMLCTEKILNLQEVKYLHPSDAAALLVVCQKVIGWYASNYEDVIVMKEDLSDALDKAKEEAESLHKDAEMARESAAVTAQLEMQARQSAADAAELHRASLRGITGSSSPSLRPSTKKADGVKLEPLERAAVAGGGASSPQEQPTTSPARTPRRDVGLRDSPSEEKRPLDGAQHEQDRRRPRTADAADDGGAVEYGTAAAAPEAVAVGTATGTATGMGTGMATAVGKSARKGKRPKERKSKPREEKEARKVAAEPVEVASEAATNGEGVGKRRLPDPVEEPALDQPGPLQTPSTPAMPSFSDTEWKVPPNAETAGSSSGASASAEVEPSGNARP